MLFIPRKVALLTLIPFLSAFATHGSRQPLRRVQGIRFWSFGDVTRVAIETTGDYKVYSEQIKKPNRVFFDLNGLQAPAAAQNGMQVIRVGDHRIQQIRVARLSASKTRIVFDLDGPVEVTSSQLVNPDRLMIEIRPKGTTIPALIASRSATSLNRPSDILMKQAPAKPTLATTQPTSQSKDADDAYHPPPHHDALDREVITDQVIVDSTTGLTASPKSAVLSPTRTEIPVDRSLVRVFGLKLGRVVIDAGHGGHDSGTIGPNGLMEKDLVLDVALRLGTLVTKRMGAEVVYTRSKDVFIPLEERTKIANEQKADLFISVHANSSPEPRATGVETYYFNLTSDKGGLDLATRENSTADSSISDLNDLLHRAVLQTKREESREFAQRVQASLTSTASRNNGSIRDRGVRQAPFVVLIGASMPSVLAEIGFVSNPRDERLLRRSDQRQKIAEALFKGVAQYASSLGHLQMARAGE